MHELRLVLMQGHDAYITYITGEAARQAIIRLVGVSFPEVTDWEEKVRFTLGKDSLKSHHSTLPPHLASPPTLAFTVHQGIPEICMRYYNNTPECLKNPHSISTHSYIDHLPSFAFSFHLFSFLTFPSTLLRLTTVTPHITTPSLPHTTSPCLTLYLPVIRTALPRLLS